MHPLGPPARPALDAVSSREGDHRTTLAQIGRMRLASLGARDIVHDDPNGRVWFRVLSGNPHRQIIVQLRGDDTYAVEIGKVRRRQLDFLSEATEGIDQGVHADQLGDTIDRLVMSVIG